MSYIGTREFYLEVAKGNVPGHTLYRKFGAIASIASATPADVWEYGVTPGAERYTFSPDNGTVGTADIDTLSSSSVSDTEDITIEGLLADGTASSQTVALQGQTEVAITPLWRVNRLYNSNGTDLVGDTYVYVGTDGSTNGVPDTVTDVRGFIGVGEGQTLQMIYTVPLGFTAYLLGIEVSLSKGGGAAAVAGNFTGKARAFGKVFRTQDKFDLNTSGTSRNILEFPVPLVFPARTDFCPVVDTTGTIGASWAISILLVEDGF